MRVRTVITLITAAIMTAGAGSAQEFDPSRSDVEDYCTKSGQVFVRAAVKAKTASAPEIESYLKKEVKRTAFVNKVFNTDEMKEFTAGKLSEDLAGAQQEINSYLDKGGDESLLVKSFSDGCVRGFFKELNR